MSSTYRPSSIQQRPDGYNAPRAAAAQPAPAAPSGTFAPGTKVQVGKHRVIIERYLSEGGFAHVYCVKVPRPDGTVHPKEVAVLKRVAVPDKEALANMRTEVETMKKLQGHKKVVTYMDSHASQLKGGGYEVFLLMEYCQGGGLIDFMNTRLQNRLTEPEILKIFADVAEGVAAMHYLIPPLLHRDLKVENVLISTAPARVYKLCDFGSAAPPRPAAKTAAEGRLIEDDVQRHTTLQYRSPEMIDVYRKQPIDEKSDIWALGVLLYKLCYYTTPFEEQGQMAILNASFKYPQYPVFSDKLKHLIGSMLRESPDKRPNIYEVVKEVCSIRGAPVPIKDIYANRSHSQARRYHELPPPSPTATSPPAIGLQKAEPVQQVQHIPDIAPMRRGRPTAPGQQRTVADHTPSPMRGAAADPFAALDSNNPAVRAAAADELASKYPSLDEFSILHDKGSKFQFDPSSLGTPPAADSKQGALQKRVTQALADDAFAQPSRAASAPAAKVPDGATASSRLSGTVRASNAPFEEQAPSLPIRRAQAQDHGIPSSKTAMISTGVGSSPPTSPYLHAGQAEFKQAPVHRFPPRASSQAAREAISTMKRQSDRPAMPDLHRSKSSITALTVPSLEVQQSSASSRPSLEGIRPHPDELEGSEALARSRSANARSGARPASAYVDKSLDYLRNRESTRFGHRATQSVSREKSPVPEVAAVDSSDEDGNLILDRKESNTIQDSVDYLRAREAESEHHHGGRAMKSVFGSKKERRSSGENSHHKRSSLGAMGHGLAKTGEIMKGRFGDAFRRFEAGNSERDNGAFYEEPASTSNLDDSDEPEHRRGMFGHHRDSSGERRSRRSGEHGRKSMDRTRARVSGEYERERTLSRERRVLTPIAASETPSSGPRSDVNDDFYDRDMEASFMEEQDLPPEVRRELERQRLAQEERRVEAAKEAYRQRAAGGGTGAGAGESKASTIQKRVMTLLDEAEGKTREPPKKTAEGYGRYNDLSRQAIDKPLPQSPPQGQRPFQPSTSAKPVPGITSTMNAPVPSRQNDLQYPKPRQPLPPISTSAPPATAPTQPITAIPTTAQPGTATAQNPRLPSTATGPRPPAPPKPSGLRTPQRTGPAGPSLEQLLAKDLQGVADMPGKPEAQQPRLDRDAQTRWGARGPASAAGAGVVGGGEGTGMSPDGDWEEQFSKRYPSLSGIEMVEADYGAVKVRDV